MKPHAHVCGAGGSGMNAIAQLLLTDGFEVTGSDRFHDQGTEVPVLDTLTRMGLTLFPQDGSGLRPDTRFLVRSTAVEADNPERLRAAQLGIPERHRAEILADYAHRGPLIAIAGTSGKTTCTGWLGRVLEQCGYSPNVVNGGAVLDWRDKERPGNVRSASPDSWWVVEVDESDKSLLRFHPDIALINSISADHHDWEETVDLFRRFARQVKQTLVCGPGVRQWIQDADGIRAKLIDVDAPAQVALPGEYNAWNGAAVRLLAEAAGADRDTATAALASFSGIERRMERRTRPEERPAVFDDFAHNPEKIAAALAAVRPESGRCLAVWRPHGFAPLRQNFDAYVQAFAEGLRERDELHLPPVFFAGGSVSKGPDSAALAQALRDRGLRAYAPESYPDTLSAGENDVILVMGARDPELPRFAARLARQVGEGRIGKTTA